MKTAPKLSGLALVSAYLFLLSQLVTIARADLQVWTLTETRHVRRSEAPEQSREARLAAARNEWESFQILVRSDMACGELRLESAALRGPGDAVLEVSEARLYRQHQLELLTGTYRNTEFQPDWYPDPLIPFLDPINGQTPRNARIKAVPFDLPANQTHGFWVDLHVPAKAVAGDNRGVYHLTSRSGAPVEIPVVLTVWDFALPETSAFETAFGSPAQRMRGYYREQSRAGHGAEPRDWAAVERECAELLAEHRVNATPPEQMLRPVAQGNGTFQIPAEQIGALRQFIDRYHVNALEVPHPSSAVKDPDAERDKLRAWLGAFDAAAAALSRPGVVLFTYLRDEPNTQEDYRYVQKWGRAIREAKSVVKVMVVEQPWTAPGQGGADSAWGDLYGAVDIWCALFSLHRQESAAQRQALGESIWTYTALCQGEPTPWWHIDFPLLNYRVPAWMAWHDRMRGLLYWGGMSYWGKVEDPWTQAPVYTGNGTFQQGNRGILFNGEGSLVYPADAVGFQGIVPTIRLKALRDGIEDYDYMALLDQLGKREQAEQIVADLTPSFFKWEQSPRAYEAARMKLARLIVLASKASAAKPAATRR